MTDLEQLRSKVDRLLADHHHAYTAVREERSSLTAARADLAALKEAQEHLQNLAQEVQNIAHEKIARIVTRCLEAIWGEEAYEFKIIFDKKRGKTEGRPCFVRDRHEVDPLTAASGGMVGVAALGLRLGDILLSRPHLRRLLVLDEPFPGVSGHRLEAVGEMMLELAEELDMQMIIVTHNEALQIGKVIQLGR